MGLLVGTPALGYLEYLWLQGHRSAKVVGRRGAANQRRADCTLINSMSFKEREVTSTAAHEMYGISLYSNGRVITRI